MLGKRNLPRVNSAKSVKSKVNIFHINYIL
nr:MAG TPA: hypothetical protein [Caudoviricetes sp.]